jgi:hypothetical protein
MPAACHRFPHWKGEADSRRLDWRADVVPNDDLMKKLQEDLKRQADAQREREQADAEWRVRGAAQKAWDAQQNSKK